MDDDAGEILKLLALDEEDLNIVSAHLQDATARMADMAYLPAEQRFVTLLNRFDWLAAETPGSAVEDFRRRRCALRFEHVLRAQVQGMSLDGGEAIAALLAITYQPEDLPGGTITLIFAGGGAIRLHVECIEAQLRDLGGVWQTNMRPDHIDRDATNASRPHLQK